MMRPSRVRQRWAAGKPAFCVGNHLTDPAAAELIALLGFDCVWIDLEHHATSVETAGRMMRGARAGGTCDVMARPAKGEFMRAARLLEAGAHGILYPRCDGPDEARELVRWTKFHPEGQRGYDSTNPDGPYGLTPASEYVREANAQTWLAVQIEDPAAAAQARAIAEVPGVDMVFFGPADFSLLAERPLCDLDDAVTMQAAEQVCRDTLAAGKRFGTLVFNTDQARRFVDLGAGFIAHGFDLGLLRRNLIQLRESMTSLGFTFG